MSQLSPSENENYRVEGFVVPEGLIITSGDLRDLLVYLIGLKENPLNLLPLVTLRLVTLILFLFSP